MSSNQSGADKDNRLLLGEQKTLLFSKSKMAEVFFQPNRSLIKNSRWRRLQSQPYCGHAVMIKTERLGSDGSLDRVLQNITGR